MKKKKLLKLIGGFGIGIGVGTCMGVAMNNIMVGFSLGIGIGLCFAVALGAFKRSKALINKSRDRSRLTFLFAKLPSRVYNDHTKVGGCSDDCPKRDI